MKSIFTDKLQVPTDVGLQAALGSTYAIWKEIRDYVIASANVTSEEWKYSGDKYGWGFRINDKKRVLIYLLPRDGFFRVAFVFGQKAFEAILDSSVSDSIKNELMEAKAYAEGRGIRIEIRDKKTLKDVKQLINSKVNS